jgi:hypothetical protein
VRLVSRYPIPPLGEVSEPWWDDRPLAIVGTGPSLKGVDFSIFKIPGVRVLAVKEAIWDLPFAEEVFSLHTPWMTDRLSELRALPQRKVFAVEPEFYPFPEIANSLYLLRTRFAGLSEKLGEIQSGANSGHGAFNYAYLKRARKVCLFGYDYSEKNGEHHHKPEQYSWYTAGQNARYWESWGHCYIEDLRQIEAAGMTVLNASLNSSVKCFPRCSVEEGVKWLQEACT